jgi:arylsulfatase A-like enzyme
VLAIWFGLVTGLLELALIHARNHFLGWSSLSALQISRHFPWMIPVANLAIFLTCGLVSGVLSRICPRFRSRPSTLVLCFLASLALFLTIPGLYTTACLALAAGFSVWTSLWIRRHSSPFGLLVVTSLPSLLVVTALLAGWHGRMAAVEERRAVSALPPAKTGVPNVLLVVMDTVRADRLSLHGYERETTPNLVRLARKGIRFDQARSTAPWTLPSHASMFTGRWPHQTGVSEDRRLDATHPTLAEFLSDHGHLTGGFVGNTYFCNSWFGLGRGFTHYEDFYDEDLVVSFAETLRCSALGRCLLRIASLPMGAERRRKDAAAVSHDFLDWLSEQDQGRPFFAFLNFFDAHTPYLLPEGAESRFGPSVHDPADTALLHNWNNRPKKNVPAKLAKLASDSYDNCIAYVDSEVGKLLDELERRCLLDNTLVIITSDHGEHLGEHGLFGHGKSLYSQELHVPLVIITPGGLVNGRIVSAPVSLRDLPATVADVVGYQTDSPFPGTSLARYWQSTLPDDQAQTTAVLSEVALRDTVSRNQSRPPAWRGPMKSIVSDGRAYIRNADGREEVYDILNDPADLRDLVGRTGSDALVEHLRGALESVLSSESGSQR